MVSDLLESLYADRLSDAQVLHTLSSDYGEIQHQREQVDAQEPQLREAIGIVVTRLGGKASSRGCQFVMTAPSVSTLYDTRALDALVLDLLTEHPDIAARIRACARTVMRAGGLRIGREQ